MKKLVLIVVLFIAASSFKNVSPSISANTTYYVVRGHLEGSDNDGCNKWVISNIAKRESSCQTESMIELLFGTYYQEKNGNTCAIRGIKAESYSNHDDAAAYQLKLINEYKTEGKETILTTDFVIKCQ